MRPVRFVVEASVRERPNVEFAFRVLVVMALEAVSVDVFTLPAVRVYPPITTLLPNPTVPARVLMLVETTIEFMTNRLLVTVLVAVIVFDIVRVLPVKSSPKRRERCRNKSPPIATSPVVEREDMFVWL